AQVRRHADGGAWFPLSGFVQAGAKEMDFFKVGTHGEGQTDEVLSIDDGRAKTAHRRRIKMETTCPSDVAGYAPSGGLMLERFLWFLRRNQLEDEMNREFQSHLETEAVEQIEAGVSASEARRAAANRFGNRAQAMENARMIWRHVWFEHLIQDVRY